MKRRLLTGLLAIQMFLSGCLNAHSLDRYGYVLCLGVDRGETLPYQMTLLLQKQDSMDGSSKNGGFVLQRAECRSLFEAIETLSASLPFQLDFARMTLLVVERRIAEDSAAMDELFDVSFSRLRVRDNIPLFVSLTTASDALDGFANDLDQNILKIQQNFINYSEKTGFVPIANIYTLREAGVTKAFDALFPLCGVTGKETARQPQDSVGTSDYEYIGGRLLVESGMKTGLAGSAIFSGNRMVGLLDGQHTQLVLLATGEFSEGGYRMRGPDGRHMELHLSKKGAPERSITLSGKPHAHTRVTVTADVTQPESGFDMPLDELETWIADGIEKELDALFSACRGLGADVFGFGKLAVMAFSSTSDWESYDWASAYRSMTASFSVRVELVNNSEKTAME